MKRVVILSDTHGNFSAIEKLLPIMEEADMVFHLGDHQSDILAYQKELKGKIYSVKGNCDGGGDEQVLTIEGVKVLLTHGNRYNVKQSLYKLQLRAEELGVDVVFFGHTHSAVETETNKIKYVNPGAMSGFFEKSYCYAVFYNGTLTTKIVPIN
ncbi:MAG: metallophosphoesterase [Clostridia bacterium]|nr:metallophosphoesterase [Clostridia bacterium]